MTLRVTISMERSDGIPQRYLWTVRKDGRLLWAGLATQKARAWEEARDAYNDALRSLNSQDRAIQPPAENAVLLDLDRLERGPAPYAREDSDG